MINNIVAIIVTRNRLKKLKKAVSLVLNQQVQGLVVIDNQSTDGTGQWLNTVKSKRLSVVITDDNIGGAGGFSLGLNKAVELYNPDWLLCFDDDAYPDRNLVSRFQALDIPSSAGIVTAAVFTPCQQIMEMNRPLLRAPISFFSIFYYLIGGRSSFVVPDNAFQPGNVVEVQASSFVGCFVKKDVMAAIGTPRQKLFIYADDIIFTYQAFQAGFKNIFYSDLVFYHDCQKTNNREIKPLWKVYFLLRNQIEMHRVFNGRLFWLPAVMRLGYCLGQTVHYRGSQRKKYLKFVWQAFYDGIKGNFISRPWSFVEKNL